MPGRHRSGAVLRRSTARIPLLIAVVVVIATGTVLVVQNLADAGGCSDTSGLRLPVTADPAIAPAIQKVADDWTAAEEPRVDGRCVAVDVAAVPTADMAGALASSAGGFVDVATPAPTETAIPAVWVPDSSYWVAQLRGVSRTLFDSALTPPAALAASPIVLGASPAGADLLGAGRVTPADLREPVLAALAAQEPPVVRLAEPRRDTAGLVGAGWLQQAVVASDEDLPTVVGAFRSLGRAPLDTPGLLASLAEAGDGPALAPVSEQAVTTYNQSAATPITVIPVADAPVLDFPYALLARQPRDVQTAANRFRDALAAAGPVFAAHGFQPVGGEGLGPPVTSLEQLAPALRIWTSATRDARVLSVVNVNSSMGEQLGAGRRIDVFAATAQQGLELFTPNSQLGHWEYADDRSEGVPIDTLDDEQKQAILAAIGAIQIRQTDQAALFETLVAAYRELKEGYDPTRSNTLIMWTDSANDQPGGPTLDETLQELEKLADVTRPIRVVLLGLGPDADMTQLEAIARTTGGGAFSLQDPDEIALIFLRALLT